MEEPNVCTDPQYVNALENCLRVEINKTKAMISGVKTKTREFQLRLRAMLLERKVLKQNVQNLERSTLELTTKITRQKKSLADIRQKVELMRLGLDDESRIIEIDIEHYKKIMKETKKTWESYHAEYEEFPLAKIRKQEWIKVETIRIQRMMLEAKIVECKKILRTQETVAWLTLRFKIVMFAQSMTRNMDLERKLPNLKKRVKDCENKLKEKQTELEVAKKIQEEEKRRQEEEKRKRERERLQMPPPTINYTHLCSMSRNPKFLENWQASRSNVSDWDTLSVDTLMLEEICESDCKSSHESESLFGGNVQNSPREEQIDAHSVSPDQQENQEMEQDAVSEPEQDAVSEPDHDSIDRRSEHNFAEEDDPVLKKMKLMSGEAIDSMALSEKSVKRKSTVPRIVNIETVHCDLSQLKTREKINPMKRSIDQSDRSSLVGMSSLREPEVDNSCTICSPQFDYADISNISFSSEMQNTKRFVLDGSFSNLCENTIVSMHSETTELEEGARRNNPTSPTSESNFLQFDFMNITKPGGNLF